MMSKRDLLVVGSEWWYMLNLTKAGVSTIFPVTKIEDGAVTVQNSLNGTHSESITQFLKRFTPVVDNSENVFTLKVLLLTAESFNLIPEVNELLVELNI